MTGVFERRAGRRISRGAALLCVAALLNLSAPALFAAPAPAVGEVVVAGALSIGGTPAVPGQTFFTGTTFSTAPDTSSALSLGNKARLELSGGTTLKVDFSGSALSGSLAKGGARFYVPEGLAASVVTADASLSTDSNAPAVFGVNVAPEGTTVSVQTGRVEMHAGGVARTVGAGEVFKASRGGVSQSGQGQNLSERKRAGIIVGIAGALAAIVLVIVGRDGDNLEQPCEARPILLSDINVSPC